MTTSKTTKLIATEEGWALQIDGLTFAGTKEPHVLGTLIWALKAEGAFDAADSAGDQVQLKLARYWGLLLDRQGAENNTDLDEDFIKARVKEAVALASDLEAKKMIATGYFKRMRETVLSRNA